MKKPILTIPDEAKKELNEPVQKPTHPLIVKICRELLFQRTKIKPNYRNRLLMYSSFDAIFVADQSRAYMEALNARVGKTIH